MKPLRALLVLLAYAGSCVAGLPFMALGFFPFLGNQPFSVLNLMPLVWIYAWVCHVRMSIAWIRDRNVPRSVPIWGTIAGVTSLASPLGFLVPQSGAPAPPGIEGLLATSAFATLFMLPCIALAIYLVRFHRQAAA